VRLSSIARALQRAVLRGLAVPATVACGCGAQTEGGSPTCAVSSTILNCGCGCASSTFPLHGTVESCGGDDAGASWPLPPSQCTALCPKNPGEQPAVTCSISANTGGPLGGPLTTSLTLSCVYTVPRASFVSFDSGVLGIDAVEAGTSDFFINSGLSYCYPTCPTGFTCEGGTPGLGLWCIADCTGRRPAGLLDSASARGSLLGIHFAEMARLEAASVDAFRHLRRELVAHGAPRHLIRAAERAARDEIRHARMTRALAHRYGSVALSPNVEPRPVRDLIGMAIENAVEGCVREAFGALVACWQGRAAVDPVIRAAMARIARDETRHAALAFQVNGWLKGKLDGPARARVAEARRQALDDLFGRSSEAPLALRAALGLPTQHQCRALAGHLARLAA
jgi:hypothetical protein